MTDHPQNDQFHASSFLQGANAEYVEQLYARFSNDPAAVDATWAAFFRSLGDASGRWAMRKTTCARKRAARPGTGRTGRRSPPTT